MPARGRLSGPALPSLDRMLCRTSLADAGKTTLTEKLVGWRAKSVVARRLLLLQRRRASAHSAQLCARWMTVLRQQLVAKSRARPALVAPQLLFGGAIHEAGEVKARANRRSATSDWMELEKVRPRSGRGTETACALVS